MSQIRNIETLWHGCRFRSRLEARWAVAFDAMRIDWEYEPQGFLLDNGETYLPDFRLRGLEGRASGDLWVEVKPDKELSEQEERKIRGFAMERPLYIVSRIPESFMWSSCMNDAWCDWRWCYSFMYVDGDDFGACLGVNRRGRPELFGVDSTYLMDANESATGLAYKAAREARFEHGDKPELQRAFLDARDVVCELRKSRPAARPDSWYEWGDGVRMIRTDREHAPMTDMPLKEGDYRFEVVGFRRSKVKSKRNEGANLAVYTLRLTNGTVSHDVRHYIPLVDSARWKMRQFFAGIGALDESSDRPFKPPWDGVLGCTGVCHAVMKEWHGSDGRTKTVNEVTAIYPSNRTR